jgi:ribonuclease HI
LANFEVRIVLEVLAAGNRLVLRGKEARLPRFELSADSDWRQEVTGFTTRVLGAAPGQPELVELECSREGLFPLLLIRARCYFRKASKPLDEKYLWESESGEAAEPPQPVSGGALDPNTTVVLFTDGGSRGNPGPAGIGGTMTQQGTGWILDYSRYIGLATNNIAEYTALLDGLKLALESGVRKLDHRADSQLMVRQLEGAYKVKSPELKPLFDEAKKLIRSLESFKTSHVRRELNKRADELANIAMDQAEADGQ